MLGQPLEEGWEAAEGGVHPALCFGRW